MIPTASRPSYLLKEFDRPLYIGSWFGFLPIDAPKITLEDEKLRESLGPSSIGDAALRMAYLRMYQDKDIASLPHPLAVSYKFKNQDRSKAPDYVFELAGFESGSGEALLIRTALSILEEEGFQKLSVELNSIGDKDSILAYERELANCLKKHSDQVDAEAKKRLRGNVFEAFEALKGTDAYTKLPPSIASLSSPSRLHFKDVLEHIEALGTGFALTPELLGNRHYASETVFRIKDEAGATLASGLRYSRLSKRAGLKREMPFAAATISAPFTRSEKIYKELPRPKYSLIHLGPSARMKALPILELLRTERIPVHHSLGREKLSPQLEAADAMKTPYLLIIGQKEALDDSVTVRNVSTRAQDTIPTQVLADYLKHIAL